MYVLMYAISARSSEQGESATVDVECNMYTRSRVTGHQTYDYLAETGETQATFCIGLACVSA